MRRSLAAATLALVVFVPLSIGASPTEVNILFSDYRPSQLDALPGETITWTNVSQRTHTVTSDTGLFDSDEIAAGERFSVLLDAVGSYPYHCTIHPGIRGEIDVRRVTLDSLPPAALPVGKPLELTGRTADRTRPVEVQRLSGSTWSTVASATPAADGRWTATIRAEAPGNYRALSGGDASQTRRLLVSIWKVSVRPTKAGLDVSVTPSAPYSRFLVELNLRERFGWYPVTSGKLDYVSAAEVRVKRPARVRIVLVDKDGWTPLATSRVITLP